MTGSEKAFAAGADIKEMQAKNWPDTFVDDFITDGWERIAQCRKPIIAAVAGFALGGGCEIALMCDFILAAETAQFGQPEIKIGVWPGAGGSQRLTRIVGKSKSMDMCLTGRMMGADEAERAGLVSRIVPAPDLVVEAVKTAQQIATMSRPAAMMVKDVSIARMRPPSAKACATNDGCSRPASVCPINVKAWPPLSKRENPILALDNRYRGEQILPGNA